MKSLIKLLFGSLKFKSKSDYLIIPLKIFYIAYSIPFLILGAGLSIRSYGTLGDEPNSNISWIKKLMIHFSNIVVSFALWGTLYTMIFIK